MSETSLNINAFTLTPIHSSTSKDQRKDHDQTYVQNTCILVYYFAVALPLLLQSNETLILIVLEIKGSIPLLIYF